MASYTKLRNGNWGIRSTAKIAVGDVVTVAKKDGTSKQERVGQIIWSDGAVWLAAIASGAVEGTSAAPYAGNGFQRRRRYGPGRCRECGEYNGLGTGCTSDPNFCFDCDS